MEVSNLKNFKDNLNNSLARDLSEFEKNFLLISVGLLAFSITFIKDIIKVNESKFLFLLLLAWVLIIVSIGFMMFAFLKSASSSDILWKTVDQLLIKHELFYESTVLTPQQITLFKEKIDPLYYSSKRSLKRLRYWAVSIFLAGLIFFAAFIGLNLLREKSIQSLQNPCVSLRGQIDTLLCHLSDSTFKLK